MAGARSQPRCRSMGREYFCCNDTVLNNGAQPCSAIKNHSIYGGDFGDEIAHVAIIAM